jgi:hypothetical protein
MVEKIGSGRRFKALAAELAARGWKNPEGGAAAIGRARYGKERFQSLALSGKKRAANKPPKPPGRIKV